MKSSVMMVLALLAAVAGACDSGGSAQRSTSVETGVTAVGASVSTVAESDAGAGSIPETGSAGAGLFSSTTMVSSADTEVTSTTCAGREAVTVTVLYDNTAAVDGVRTGHGFSCLVEGLPLTVLFDTGADGEALLGNMEALGVDPQDIDMVVLSHDHDDHTGGLAQVVVAHPEVAVYYPASFARGAVASAREAGADLVPVEGRVSPCPGLTITAPTGSPSESGLLADTSFGPVLVVGCAHPGVVEMTAAAAEVSGGPVFAVMGGFHLKSKSAAQVARIIEGLEQLGVERCGPAHCTGEAAITQITAAFGEGAIPMGVGATIRF